MKQPPTNSESVDPKNLVQFQLNEQDQVVVANTSRTLISVLRMALNNANTLSTIKNLEELCRCCDAISHQAKCAAIGAETFAKAAENKLIAKVREG